MITPHKVLFAVQTQQKTNIPLGRITQ